MSEGDTVLVTGASGFLAGHVVKTLQEAGYKVRGTVRSAKNADKVKHLHGICPDAAYPLELVEADLTDPDCWERAVNGMKFVIHVASPFPLERPKNEDEVIRPAVDGTLNVLRACANFAASISRVVLTSSCAAVDWMSKTHDKPRDESYWSDSSKQDPYSKSKTLAEKAAWEYLDNLPEEEKFELAVINPSLILGPPLQGSVCTSVQIMQKLLNRAMPMLPNVSFPIIDVRDAALAHVRAMTIPDAAGRRHIATNTNMWFSQIGIVLKAVFGPQGYKVPTRVAPKLFLYVVSLFDRSVRAVLPNVGVVHLYDNSRLRTVLKVEPREVKDTLVEMAYAVIEAGFVKKTPQYKGPGGPKEREMYMKTKI
ncbi:uncharacterized protein LOC143275231 [Babylonia areolata]|uniref:uncharacterized protein LOC143275231 n=1 Tax=Babylonia areolata TaxID=304850 RepID=UPI003FCF1171